jgi:protein-disulfide isomerase
MTGLLDHVLNAPAWAVYIVVALVVFAEDALFLGFVIPGETAAVLGGVLASRGHINVEAVGACVVAAAIRGDSFGYEVGRHNGPRILQSRRLDRRRESLERAQDLLARRGGSAVFLGRFVAFFTKVSHGRIRPPVGSAAVLGGGAIAGIGFTVALLIADRAFSGAELAEAKLGALSAALVASMVTWLVFRFTATLSPARRARTLLGDTTLIQDLIPEVDPSCDHLRGSPGASMTLIEFGDLECPYCGRAEPVIRELLADTDLRYVWRHLPLTDVHPAAQLAAEAAEAAGAQGAFWEMHDLLFAHQDALAFTDLLRYAGELGLDVDRFRDELERHVYEARIAQDVESADLSGVSGTPTFFINGQRHYGAYDIETLKAAVKTARSQLHATRAGRGQADDRLSNPSGPIRRGRNW